MSLTACSIEAAAKRPAGVAATIKRYSLGLLILSGASVAVAIYARVNFGSGVAVAAYFRGQAVSIEPRRIQLGEVCPNHRIAATLTLQNLTAAPVKVLGAHSDCGCFTVVELPLVIQPNHAAAVEVSFRLPCGHPGTFEHSLQLYLDAPSTAARITVRGVRLSASEETCMATARALPVPLPIPMPAAPNEQLESETQRHVQSNVEATTSYEIERSEDPL